MIPKDLIVCHHSVAASVWDNLITASFFKSHDGVIGPRRSWAPYCALIGLTSCSCLCLKHLSFCHTSLPVGQRLLWLELIPLLGLGAFSMSFSGMPCDLLWTSFVFQSTPSVTPDLWPPPSSFCGRSCLIYEEQLSPSNLSLLSPRYKCELPKSSDSHLFQKPYYNFL